MCLSVPVLSMADGGTWWKAEILSYKHAIAPYGGPPFTNCLWQLEKNAPWPLFHNSGSTYAKPAENVIPVGVTLTKSSKGNLYQFVL